VVWRRAVTRGNKPHPCAPRSSATFHVASGSASPPPSNAKGGPHRPLARPDLPLSPPSPRALPPEALSLPRPAAPGHAARGPRVRRLGLRQPVAAFGRQPAAVKHPEIYYKPSRKDTARPAAPARNRAVPASRIGRAGDSPPASTIIIVINPAAPVPPPRVSKTHDLLRPSCAGRRRPAPAIPPLRPFAPSPLRPFAPSPPFSGALSAPRSLLPRVPREKLRRGTPVLPSSREKIRKILPKGVDPGADPGRFLPAARKQRRERRESIAAPQGSDRLFSPLERRSFTSMARQRRAGIC
jgi:hypothetical protein